MQRHVAGLGVATRDRALFIGVEIVLFNITYTSLNFIFFVLATMLVYFLFPAKKYKWTVLLAASMFFYAVAGYTKLKCRSVWL